MMGNEKNIVKEPKKKILLFSIILIDIISVGIIPLNLFVINMPEYISIIISVGILLLNIMLWFAGKQRKAVKAVLSLVSLVTALFSLFGTYCNPYWNSLFYRTNYTITVKDDSMILSQDKALADLDYAMKYLRKLHPALYSGIPEDIQNQYERSKQNLINCEQIDICTLIREIESIFSLLHDAHTHVVAVYNEQHYLKYIAEHNEAGDRLIKINGIPLEELFQANSHLVSYETEDWGMTYIYEYVSSAEGLEYLGISIEDGVEYTYENVNGEQISFVFTADDFVTYQEYAEFNGIDTDADTDVSFVHYEIDAENDIAILTLDSCDNNEEYRNCLHNMFAEIKEQGIGNVAVDLRNNGGGDSSVANEFFRYLNIDSYKEWADVWRMGFFKIKNNGAERKNDNYEDFLFDGNLYLLTSVHTFSSAMDFAMLVKDNHLGTIIGEAPGNHPGSYGQIAFFTLPNSGLYMQISTKKWFRVDETLGDQLIEPDISSEAKNAVEYLYNAIQ